MPRLCSECSFELKNADPHSTCVAHSSGVGSPYFDPRQCEECVTLFEKAKTGPLSYSCWQHKLRRLDQHPDHPSLHPDATDYDLLADPTAGSSSNCNTDTSQLEISKKTFEILQRLESALE